MLFSSELSVEGPTTGGYSTVTPANINVLRRKMTLLYLPEIAFLGLLILLGVVGNCLVLYIFRFRLSPSVQNFLILCLAVFDLLNTIIGMSGDITIICLIYVFPSAWACKLIRFVTTFTSIGSIFTLTLIALDRYRKICKPLEGQMTIRQARRAMCAVLVTTTVLSWPAVCLYGIHVMPASDFVIKGRTCTITNENKHSALIYNLCLLVSSLIGTAILLVFYSLILRAMKRRKARHNTPNSENTAAKNREPRNRLCRAKEGGPNASISKECIDNTPSKYSSCAHRVFGNSAVTEISNIRKTYRVSNGRLRISENKVKVENGVSGTEVSNARKTYRISNGTSGIFENKVKVNSGVSGNSSVTVVSNARKTYEVSNGRSGITENKVKLENGSLVEIVAGLSDGDVTDSTGRISHILNAQKNVTGADILSPGDNLSSSIARSRDNWNSCTSLADSSNTKNGPEFTNHGELDSVTTIRTDSTKEIYVPGRSSLSSNVEEIYLSLSSTQNEQDSRETNEMFEQGQCERLRDRSIDSARPYLHVHWADGSEALLGASAVAEAHKQINFGRKSAGSSDKDFSGNFTIDTGYRHEGYRVQDAGNCVIKKELVRSESHSHSSKNGNNHIQDLSGGFKTDGNPFTRKHACKIYSTGSENCEDEKYQSADYNIRDLSKLRSGQSMLTVQLEKDLSYEHVANNPDGLVIEEYEKQITFKSSTQAKIRKSNESGSIFREEITDDLIRSVPVGPVTEESGKYINFKSSTQTKVRNSSVTGSIFREETNDDLIRSFPAGPGVSGYGTYGSCAISNSSAANLVNDRSHKSPGPTKRTVVAIMISLVFILSFLPPLTAQILKCVFNLEDRDWSIRKVVLDFCARFYFINSAANPFIYGIFNNAFREEVKVLFKRFCCRRRIPA